MVLISNTVNSDLNHTFSSAFWSVLGDDTMMNVLSALLLFAFLLFLVLGAFIIMRSYRPYSLSTQLLNDTIFSEMMDLAVILTSDGKISKVSRSTETLLGYNTDELIGQSVHLIIQDDNLIHDLMSEKRSPAICRYTEVSFLTSTGELLPVQISCLPLIKGRQGAPDGIVLLGHDNRLTKQLENQIAENKVTLEKLHHSEKRFKDIFSKNSAAMYLLDSETLKIVDMNKTARDFYGYTREECIQRKVTEINGLTDDQERELIASLDSGSQNVFNLRHMTATGQWRDVEVRATNLIMNGKKVIISIIIDITDRKKAEEQISFLAYHDALTGLANRKAFYERLHIELERSLRTGRKAAILFLDLDGFKLINDNYGHEAGDFLLKEVAGRLKDVLRGTDTVARMGGDEFTLLLTDINDRSKAEIVADKLKKSINEPIIIEGNPMRIQASIGISIFPDDGSDEKQLLSKADQEMYIMKNGARVQ